MTQERSAEVLEEIAERNLRDKFAAVVKCRRLFKEADLKWLRAVADEAVARDGRESAYERLRQAENELLKIAQC